MLRRYRSAPATGVRVGVASGSRSLRVVDTDAHRDGDTTAAPGATREARIATRARNPKWRNPALRIDMDVCINCDTCLRHCPPHFGAIFNHGMDVVIVAELCSGCGKCVAPCPVDCILAFPEWREHPTPLSWWREPGGPDDPYA